MIRNITIASVVMMASFLGSVPAFSSTERLIEIDTVPAAYSPSIRLDNVYGTLSEVTDVKIKIEGIPVELALQNTGDRTWEVKLTPEQLKALLGGATSKTFESRLLINSKNSKNRTETKEDIIQLTIHS